MDINGPTPAAAGRVDDAYTIGGADIYPEGIAYDDRTDRILTTSMLTGAVFWAGTGDQEFSVMAPPPVCMSSTGIAVDGERRRILVCGGVTGRALVFDADSGALITRATNGLVIGTPSSVAPSPDAVTFVNDVAVHDGDAYLTDSYHPTIWRLASSDVGRLTAGEEVLLEPWLSLDGSPIRYEDGDTVAARFNLNGIVSIPNAGLLIVVQTNTGKPYRIDVASRLIIEIKGDGNPGGDGLLVLGDQDLLAVDMTKSPTLTRLRFSQEWDRYEVVSRADAPGNVSPTAALVLGDRLLLTESQISDVLVGGAAPHLPYRVTIHPLSILEPN